MIKRIIFSALISILAFGSSFGQDELKQDEVKWYTIKEALELTAKEPRILIIDVYTDWCGWCKRMDAATFSDKGIAATLNKDFYPVKLNAEQKGEIIIGEQSYKFVDNGRRGYHELAAIVTKGRLSYPTISVVDEKGRVLNAYPGYKDADQFKLFLAYFNEDAYKDQSWEEYRDGEKDLSVPVI